jgi:UDP-N-acetylmuramate dehydrogenase
MQVHKNYLLKELNTFGISAYAKYFSEFNSTEELQVLLNNAEKQISTFILGGGSNVLFTKDFDGYVLKNNVPGIEVVKEDEDDIFIKAGAGVNWHHFVKYCVNNNYAGVENLSLIPGNVGASPMQNIGAYGVEIKDVFYELEAFHLHEKVIQKFTSADCEFGYRESVFKKKFKNQFVILNVTYRLKKNPVFNISYGAIEHELERMKIEKLSIKAISDAVIRIRSSKLPEPKIIGNAGSFFKNPVINQDQFFQVQKTHPNILFYKQDDAHFKIPAGWLIEQCGWKGYRSGDAGCYEKQALVLVNYGNASGNEIFELSEKIKLSVRDQFGILLETEVNII